MTEPNRPLHALDDDADNENLGLPLRGLAMILIAVAVLLIGWGVFSLSGNDSDESEQASQTQQTQGQQGQQGEQAKQGEKPSAPEGEDPKRPDAEDTEKPKPEDAPSLFAAAGRYVLDRAIFDALRRIPKGCLLYTSDAADDCSIV